MKALVRRRWTLAMLGALSWTAAALGVLLGTAACGPQGSEAPERPEAVILMIGDGMGASQISFARRLLLPPGERFALEELPVVGLMSTYSASNAVTDSGAAATAMASGIKTLNQVVGVDPQLRPVPTLADRAHEEGWRIGYVTTTAVTHATPAAFYASVPDRYADVDEIADQLLDQAPDVVLGGGLDNFLPPLKYGRRQDGRDLLEEARSAGYTVWDSSSDLDATPPAKLLGLFAANHLPYELDNQRLPEAQRYPDLEKLTRIALDALGRDGRPFFLMIEGGRIDHAAHAFDATGVAAEMAGFDRAVRAVLDFRQRHPKTLVVITADHATGGLAINDFVDWPALGRQKASIEWMVADVRDEDEPAGAEYLGEMTGFTDFTEDEATKIRERGDKYDAYRELGTMLGERQGVTWVPRIDPLDTKGHTGEDVPLYAEGPGAEAFGGTLDNTDVPKILSRLLGWAPPTP